MAMDMDGVPVVGLPEETNGMSLLDYFAAHALSGILAQVDSEVGESNQAFPTAAWNLDKSNQVTAAAQAAYRVAEAMIAERERRMQ